MDIACTITTKAPPTEILGTISISMVCFYPTHTACGNTMTSFYKVLNTNFAPSTSSFRMPSGSCVILR